ncbi:MAG: hypothetical protein M1546_12285 [Chloroflexi bacterium]|nr:hypothetical protein [Chloroflexota bacterium]
MTTQDAGFWDKARRARDKLAAQFVDHPAVSLIDIGTVHAEGQRTDRLAIRIHLRDTWLLAHPQHTLNFPDQVDGILVAVLGGNYRLEDDGGGAGTTGA